MKHDSEPVALTIFGISGDLAKRKLLPALYHLLDFNLLPKKFVIFGVYRSELNIEKLLSETAKMLTLENTVVKNDVLIRLGKLIIPIKMESTNSQDYNQLNKNLENLDNLQKEKYKRIFYLAIPPNIFNDVISALGESVLAKNGCILIEKPFGRDLDSAKNLIEFISHYFSEEQIFRIDHYLAKETAQNILAFRFNNPLVEGLWSKQYIDHIQISALELIGIESRGNFYEDTGALRDIVQSHLLQLLALTMMEAPTKQEPEYIHAEKLKLLKSITKLKIENIENIAVRGQYDGYLEETGNNNSKVETFAAIKLEVANSRWEGVPVLLRTGKNLSERTTEIKVVFKDRSEREIPANIMSFQIQPNEGISIELLVKKPGFVSELQPVDMSFCYNTNFFGHNPDAYQRVLIDAINGDKSLFATSGEVLTSWELLDPVLKAWDKSPNKPEIYEKGSYGPEAADKLAESFGCEWLSSSNHICKINI